MENVLKDNAYVMKMVKKYQVNYILIDEEYQVEIDLSRERIKQ